MTLTAVLALVVFATAYVVIVTEKFNRALVALLGATAMVAIGAVRGHEIFFSEETGIDWNVIFLLFGMMVIVGVLRQTGVFEFLAIWSAQRARGAPVQDDGPPGADHGFRLGPPGQRHDRAARRAGHAVAV